MLEVLPENISQDSLIELMIRFSKAGREYFFDRLVPLQELFDFKQSDSRGAFAGESIGAGADAWKSNRANRMFGCESQGIAIAARQQLVLVMFAAVPNRTHRVDHPFGGQLVTFGDFGFAGRTAVEFAAFLQQLRSRGAVNSAVNSSAAQQRLVGRIHDGIHLELG